MDAQLKKAYMDILSDYSECFFDKNRKECASYSALSGIFLSTTPEIWEQGKRIHVIGRETRGWNVLKDKPYTTLDDYVNVSMDLQKTYLHNNIQGNKKRGSTLFHFLQSVGSCVGNENVG